MAAAGGDSGGFERTIAYGRTTHSTDPYAEDAAFADYMRKVSNDRGKEKKKKRGKEKKRGK